LPLTSKGREIESAMKKEYGEKKGEQVLYASKNAGTITGIDHTAELEKSLPAVVSAAQCKADAKRLWSQDPERPNNAAIDKNPGRK
jgi:hypothetical protein